MTTIEEQPPEIKIPNLGGLIGRFAMLGLIAAVGAYLTTGQIIPGFV